MRRYLGVLQCNLQAFSHHLTGYCTFLFPFPVLASHSTLPTASMGCTEPGSQTQCGKEGRNHHECLQLARLQESTTQRKQVFLFFHQIKCVLDQALKVFMLSFKEQLTLSAVFRHTVLFDMYRCLTYCFNPRIK